MATRERHLQAAVEERQVTRAAHQAVSRRRALTGWALVFAFVGAAAEAEARHRAQLAADDDAIRRYGGTPETTETTTSDSTESA